MNQQPPHNLFAVGRIVGSWGRKGLVKVHPLTDFPEKLPHKQEVWLWREDTGARRVIITDGRLMGKHVLLGLVGVEAISEAKALKGSLLMVDETNLERLPENTYYHHQIIGLTVRRENGETVGKVEEVLATGASDVYVIRKGTKEILLPAVKECILKIDLAGKEMIVRMASAFEPEENR